MPLPEFRIPDARLMDIGGIDFQAFPRQYSGARQIPASHAIFAVGRPTDHIEQRIAVDRFSEVPATASPANSLPSLVPVIGRQEDYWQIGTNLSQSFRQLQRAYPRHIDVSYNAGIVMTKAALQKRIDAGKRLVAVAL